MIAVRVETKITKITAFSIKPTNSSTCLLITNLSYQFVLIVERYLFERKAYFQKNLDVRTKERDEVPLKSNVFSNQ